MGTHYLLTVLGTNPQMANYTLGDGGRQSEKELAPLALVDLLEESERPHHVLAACTPEAKEKSFAKLESALSGLCRVQVIDVPAGGKHEDVNRFLSHVTSAIPNELGTELTVDVTHGFRHFSYLMYLAALYLVALRGIRLRGAYYGLFQGKDNPSPFFDLRPLLTLPLWFHAIKVLGETGSALPISDLLKEQGQHPATRSIVKDLEHISKAYLSGLPLELGRHVNRFRSQRRKVLRKLLKKDHHLPLTEEMVAKLNQALETFALGQEVTHKGWKKRVRLCGEELERQANVIDDLFLRGHVSSALGLLNEWTVSWVLWSLGRGQGQAIEWLDFRRARRPAAGLLGALAAVSKDVDLEARLSESQRRLAAFWNDLSELRNAFHHHGMRPQALTDDRQVADKLDKVQGYWRNVLKACPTFSLEFGASQGHKVLVSPLGRRPGVLFSAIHACRARVKEAPALCLVICSQDTKARAAEAARKADYQGKLEYMRLEDPYGGMAEIEGLEKRAKPYLLEAEEVLVNVTGGTTLMGLAAERLAEVAHRLARPVRRFGLVDRRPPQQQDADPYQPGSPFWLNGEENYGNNY